MTHAAKDVARWFLQRNDIEDKNGGADAITDLKLQKLMYYAQGMSLAMRGMPMFAEPIEAWQHGPVVPCIYQIYKRYGANGIDYTDDDAPQEEYTDEDKEVLETVYNYFGQFSAWKLRDMTHSEDPWKNTPLCHVITTDAIKQFFDKRYVENETA